eukprot:jgi/Psemu1/8016/gm1.8016_g
MGVNNKNNSNNFRPQCPPTVTTTTTTMTANNPSSSELNRPLTTTRTATTTMRTSFRMEQGCFAVLNDASKSFLSPTAAAFANQELDFDFCMRPTDLIRAHNLVAPTATSPAKAKTTTL